MYTHVYIYTHRHAYRCAYVCIYTHKYTYIYIYIYMCVNMSMSMYMSVCVYIYICICIYIYVCVRVRVHVCVCMRMYMIGMYVDVHMYVLGSLSLQVLLSRRGRSFFWKEAQKPVLVLVGTPPQKPELLNRSSKKKDAVTSYSCESLTNQTTPNTRDTGLPGAQLAVQVSPSCRQLPQPGVPETILLGSTSARKGLWVCEGDPLQAGSGPASSLYPIPCDATACTYTQAPAKEAVLVETPMASTLHAAVEAQARSACHVGGQLAPKKQRLPVTEPASRLQTLPI